jgi:5-methylcytosine-specific restriction endonuclease McrA
MIEAQHIRPGDVIRIATSSDGRHLRAPMITSTCQRWRARRDSYRPAGEPIATRLYEVAEIPDDTTAKAGCMGLHRGYTLHVANRIARPPPAGSTCVYCSTALATLWDHVVPLKRGGPDTEANLLPSCSSCNTSKNGRLPSEWDLTRAARDGVRHSDLALAVEARIVPTIALTPSTLVPGETRRRVLELHGLGLTQVEIGRRVGRSQSCVSSHLRRHRESVRGRREAVR